MSDHIDKELLIDYQFGLLEGEEKETVEAHLKGCESCQDVLKTVKVQFGQLDLIRDREEELADGLLASIQEMAREPRPQSTERVG